MAKQTEDEDFPDFEDLPEEDHDLEDEDEDFDDLDLEDEDFMQDVEDDQTRQLAAPPLPSRAAPSPKEASQIPASHPTIQPDQIPLSIAVEIGRIQISIQKLMELEPGNLLELNIRPEDGVNLTVNGKVVGKGELIRIGEVLGVRILDLGR